MKLLFGEQEEVAVDKQIVVRPEDHIPCSLDCDDVSGMKRYGCSSSTHWSVNGVWLSFVLKTQYTKLRLITRLMTVLPIGFETDAKNVDDFLCESKWV